MLLLPRLHDLTLLHLLEREAPLLAITGDHDQLHPPEPAHAQGRDYAEVRQLQAFKLFVDTEIGMTMRTETDDGDG